MATFFLFGKYSSEALKGISAKRTKETADIVKKLGGKVKFIYALLGCYDLVIVVELPGIQEAMKASIALAELTGIGFTTNPAVPVEAFDKLMD